jgi:hypothetical protein
MTELDSLTNYFRKMIGGSCRAFEIQQAESQSGVSVTVTIPGDDIPQILRAFDFSERTTMAERIIELENELFEERRDHLRIVQRIADDIVAATRNALCATKEHHR